VFCYARHAIEAGAEPSEKILRDDEESICHERGGIEFALSDAILKCFGFGVELRVC
jgi:hypothetical protein